MHLLYFQFIVLSLMLLQSCGSGSENAAHLRHIWGLTRRGNIPTFSAERCQSNVSTVSQDLRLRNLAARIAAASPETFRNELDISRVCIGVDLSLKGIEARSSPDNLNIFFSVEMLETAKTDGQLAAVLSHELAHLSLQHMGFGETPPLLDSDEIFLKWKIEGSEIQTAIAKLALSHAKSEDIFILSEKFFTILRKMNRRIDELYGELNAHKNWMEQEADEVGAEFFLRSGFEPENFIDILWKTSHEGSLDRQSCEALIKAARVSGFVQKRPDRGEKNHPTTCWRVFHLAIDEWSMAHPDVTRTSLF